VPRAIHESEVEENVLAILENLGYELVRGDSEEHLPGGRWALREDYKDVVLVKKLGEALRRINPSVSQDAIEQAVKQVLRTQSQNLIEDNESFHKILVDGVDIAFQSAGEERYQKVWLFDFENPERNDFLRDQFRRVQNIERQGIGCLLLHDLEPELELRKIAAGDSVE